MGIEYNLLDVRNKNAQRDLELELAPRNSCEEYVARKGGKAELITKEEFDTYYRAKGFEDGPHMESFGDDYGEPYNPNRQAFGLLKSGIVVYCELSKANQEKTNHLIKHASEKRLPSSETRP